MPVEDLWKATRLRQLEAEYAAIEATPEPPNFMVASDADDDYAPPPETYAAADLAALRARGDVKVKEEAQRRPL